MAEFENLFIYISDSLRLDHVPGSVAEEGNVVPTLIPAGYSPISFASIASGLDPRNHSVRSFYDTMQRETVFDRFDDHSFYDHPDDALSRNVFGRADRKELEDQEPPFVHVERAMDTHTPYGAMGHGNVLENGEEGKSYREGVESTGEHFWSHVEELEQRGLLEDTLVVFTSDHGEMLGERRLFRERYGHNRPIRRELCVVPTVFLNHGNDWTRMRSIDIVPTALSLLGRETIGDGRDLTTAEEPVSGHTMLQVNTHPLVVTGCDWRWDGEWKRGSGRVKVDIATLGIDVFNPLRERLRDTWIGRMLGTDPSERRNLPTEELEGVDV